MDDKDYDRGQEVKIQLNQIVDTLNVMKIGFPLIWLWAWDIIRDKFENYSNSDVSIDYVVTEGTTLDLIWDKLWASPPADFTLEYGAEQMDEAVHDWMIDNDFITLLDDDGWLDDEDSDYVQSDNTTEYRMQEPGFKAEPVVLEGSTQ